jgi:hypothetical protein
MFSSPPGKLGHQSAIQRFISGIVVAAKWTVWFFTLGCDKLIVVINIAEGFMKKSILLIAILLAGCAGIKTVKDKPQLYNGKFDGVHTRLSHCIVNKLRSDTRWVINSQQFKIWEYPEIATSEVYAYALHALPEMYSRISPLNPDAIFDYSPPQAVIRTYSNGPYVGPEYSFTLLLKQANSSTVTAILKGEMYEGRIAWDGLLTCALDLNAQE